MKRTWWKEAVVYQVYWRSFLDTNGDGYGDLEGVRQKLGYIKELGADVIWLNPFYVSPDKDNGYDIADYYRVMDKAGTMEDFERLLKEAHELGLKVILDLVVNHTSDEHPWFREAKASKTSPKRDYYIWHDPVDGEAPNNWRSYFAPSCWEYDEGSDQYYYHSFAVEQPDLNWENEELRHEIYNMMRFWLDKGIDGFRMDVINLLAKRKDLSDVDNPYDLSYLANNPGIHDYLQEMRDEVLKHYDCMTVGEIPFVTPKEGLLYVDEARGELDTLFHFQIADEMPTWDMLRFKQIQRDWYKGLNGRGWNSQFLNNHDHTRQVTRYGNDGEHRVASAKLLATLTHTLPGMPYIYQGEEIGMTGVKFDSIDDYQDIAMKNRYVEEVGKGRDPKDVLVSLQLLSRDNSRTPMQWNAQKHGGFTEGKPWMPVNPNYERLNVETDLSREDSVFHYYQQLIRLRKNNPALIYGEFTDLLPEDESLHAYERKLGQVRFVIVLNHSHETRTLPFSIDAQSLVLQNVENGTDGLLPYEARIYMTKTAQ
ncbi:MULTISPECIES: alpha,alpha-phosphotrehalase [unclassified Exiguobacterium]|uniref:alpha,alpha-phosphotrehalase n=1 Tax=unclassified Exiguobacterium TaxID=2644629 RepID=UPI00103E1026|nr:MULTISPECIES: alpha,alpha-phosphotrehalase [unclassified Exiguobacterium]TCI48339.1 alpha,alpha-phosphotrehalase [Exiguobacterium sp. SH5S32]TCI75019.1 alpha,alpha-phosphotrehalase [Exiguobacterium sp. SH1S1]